MHVGLFLDILQAIHVADLVVLLENGHITYCGKPDGLPSSFFYDEVPKGSRMLPDSESLLKSDSTLENAAPREGKHVSAVSKSPTSSWAITACMFP